MTKTYHYITIREGPGPDQAEGKPWYSIVNNRSRDAIGELTYYGPWKQYVFSAYESTVWNDACLRDVLEFMQWLRHQAAKEADEKARAGA